MSERTFKDAWRARSNVSDDLSHAAATALTLQVRPCSLITSTSLFRRRTADADADCTVQWHSSSHFLGRPIDGQRSVGARQCLTPFVL